MNTTLQALSHHHQVPAACGESDTEQAQSSDGFAGSRERGRNPNQPRDGCRFAARSLRGRIDRGEKSAARGQVFDDSPVHSTAMGQESAEIMDRADGFADRSTSVAQTPSIA